VHCGAVENVTEVTAEVRGQIAEVKPYVRGAFAGAKSGDRITRLQERRNFTSAT